MTSPTVVNFVKQQGVTGAEQASCGSQFQALNFQPRIIGPLAVLAVILQSAPLFLTLGTIQSWCALFPRLNPFDAIYNRFIAHEDATRLAPAPGPRRFAMGMASSFMLGIGFALITGQGTLAIVLQVFLLMAPIL